MQELVSRYLGPMEASWQPRFLTYYLLPIALHLAKLLVFLALGVVGMLAFDTLVFAGFAIYRHPYAVSMTVSYASDLEKFPQLARAVAGCLFWEWYAQDVYNEIMPRFDLLWLNTAILAVYAAWSLSHQAYTLYCPGPPGRLSALSVFLCRSVFYDVFVWARRALNSHLH